jgi:hypothetical protein
MVAGGFVLVALVAVAAALAVSGCDEADCAPCQNSGDRTCPNVQGNLTGEIQISEGSCDVPWGGQGQVSLSIEQTQVNPGEDDEYSELKIMIIWSAGGLMLLTLQGELCDTDDRAFPKRYPFHASSQDTSDDKNISYALGGDIIVYDPLESRNPDFCGAISIVVNSAEETCSMAAVVYSQESLCSN